MAENACAAGGVLRLAPGPKGDTSKVAKSEFWKITAAEGHVTLVHLKCPLTPIRSVVLVKSSCIRIVLNVPYSLVSDFDVLLHPLLSKYNVSTGIPKVPAGHSLTFSPNKNELPENVITPFLT